MPAPEPLCIATFATHLGWIALAGRGTTIHQITFARASHTAALAALDPAIRACGRSCNWNPVLARRLRDYAAGAADDFRDVELELAHLTSFQRRIVQACRAIGYGQTYSYGELAAAAGNARAARAVGNTMAANRFALVVPCHRVTHRGGDVGRLSGAARLRKQLRLLESREMPRLVDVEPPNSRSGRHRRPRLAIASTPR